MIACPSGGEQLINIFRRDAKWRGGCGAAVGSLARWGRAASRGCCPCGKDAALDNLHYNTAARPAPRMIQKHTQRASLWHTRARRCLEIEKGLQKWATGGGGGGSFAAAFFLRAPFSGRSVPRVSENVRRISTHPPALQLDTASQPARALFHLVHKNFVPHILYIRRPCLTQLSIFVLFTIIEFG